MRTRPSQPRRRGLLAVALAAVFTALVCVVAAPTPALAIDVYVAHSLDDAGNRTDYKTVADAIKDGYNGKKIFMDADWPVEVYGRGEAMDLGGITVEEGKKLTIDMNGHKIYNKGKDSVAGYIDTPTICVQKNAELVLTANSTARQTKISYKGFDPEDETYEDNRVDYTVTTGGLVTNTSNWKPGILVCESGKVTLDGVTVAGCYGTFTYTDNKYNQRHHTLMGLHGAVTLSKDSILNMKNGASIEHNATFKSGAGVKIAGSNVTVNLEGGSSIHHNRAFANRGHVGCGGGIYSASSGTRITMSGDSKIYSNTADAGGGICLEGGGFTVTSSDGNATISSNRAVHSDRFESRGKQSGGGILVSESGGGSIENITISENYSAYDGGGIELDKGNVTVRNCAITGNKCFYEGGGICVSSGDNTIEGCTITGNYCDGAEKNYEGGGVFVGCQHDVKLSGTCVIKGNTRRANSGDADDVFLNANFGASMKAYITGSLSQGSSVGVRTGTTGDRRVAKNFKPASKDCLFYDMDGYYVSYGTDEGGDAWQRHTTKEFTVKLGGEVYGKYRNGASVALAAPATKDGKVFWRWDTGSNGTTGLYPLGDYITEKGALSNALAFTMPQNDVSLVPLYIDKVKVARFVVEAPEAGKALATTGKLWRTDGGANASVSVPCSVYWYEVDKDGNVSDTSAVGVAKANTRYKAYVTAPESGDKGFFYDDAISVAVSLVSASGDLVAEPKVTDAYLTLSNSVAAKTDAYKTGDGAGQGAKTGTVEVKMRGEGLLGQGEAAVASLALDGDSGADARAASADSVRISYTYDDESDTVSIAAPAKEGYNFCNWEAAGDLGASDEEVVTIPVSKLLEIGSLTAVYTPVVTQVDVATDEPAPAAGEKLAASVGSVVLTCSDGSRVDLLKQIGEGERGIEWSPEAEDGAAGFSTAYTALVPLVDADGLEDVEKVIASDARVGVACAGGVVEAEGAGFTVVDGKLCLVISFAETRDAKATSVAAPATVELTFEEAKACAESGSWPLPGAVDIQVEGDTVAEGDVEWAAVEGFDAGAAAAQELTVCGKVTRVVTADDSAVDTSEVSLDVTTTIKVAAPAAQVSDESEAGTTTEAKPATATKASKKGTPSTGDAAWSGFAALLALSAVCLAAARLSHRKN